MAFQLELTKSFSKKYGYTFLTHEHFVQNPDARVKAAVRRLEKRVA